MWSPRDFFIVAVLAVAFSLMSGVSSAQGASGPPIDVPVKVMTFNLRFASMQGENSWPVRRPVMSECIAQSAPDLIGTQEGLYYQLRNIAADRPEYEWIGQGRDGGSRGESMAIFYRKSRFEPLEYDYFWLSDTPAVVGSTTWGNQNIRMVTWVKFHDRLANRDFYFWDTHLDHVSQTAREKAAALIVQRVDALKTTLPIILTGDFNAAAKTNKAYQILTGDKGRDETAGGFIDTWYSAGRRVGDDFSTFHGYGKPTPSGVHIDWILSRNGVTADESTVVTFEKNGQRPSDHYPVMATLRGARREAGEAPLSREADWESRAPTQSVAG